MCNIIRRLRGSSIIGVAAYCLGTNDEGRRFFRIFNCKLAMGTHKLPNISTHLKTYFAFVGKAMIQSIHIDGTVNCVRDDRMRTVSRKEIYTTIT
jgi:hypothetical protein